MDKGYLVPKRGSRVKAIKSASRSLTFGFSKGRQRYNPISAPHEIMERYLSLKGSPTCHASILDFALLLGLGTYQNLHERIVLLECISSSIEVNNQKFPRNNQAKLIQEKNKLKEQETRQYLSS